MVANPCCSSRTFLAVPSSSSFRPNFGSKPTVKLFSLRVARRIRALASKHASWEPIISCSAELNSEAYSGAGQSSIPSDSPKEATIDLNFPRRSLLVNFTCNICGARSQRLINRLAYERGTVFVQCSGCSQYHKLVDNLDLVVEYDLREEMGMDSDADQG